RQGPQPARRRHHGGREDRGPAAREHPPRPGGVLQAQAFGQGALYPHDVLLRGPHAEGDRADPRPLGVPRLPAPREARDPAPHVPQAQAGGDRLMPRGPSDRPPRRAAGDAALEAAARQALERAAAPVPPPPAREPEPPAPPPRVGRAEPVRGATVQGRTRGARSFVLERKGRRKREEPPGGPPPPDPGGRGRRV